MELIKFYCKEANGLAHKLTKSVDTNEAKIKVIKSDFEKHNWRINRRDVKLVEKVGQGEFAGTSSLSHNQNLVIIIIGTSS